ncbi:MAG: ABC transporter ATP-binding protein [Chloroflexota bacterium]
MNQSSNHAIRLENLSKSYRKNRREAVQAVQDLSLTVPQGQVMGFLGENGAGKTTTIKMMCGLMRPTAGRVSLNGIDVISHRSQAMSQVGAVLEGTRNVYWRLTAWQNLLYFGRLKGFSGRSLRQRAESLLRELELWERRNDEVKGFSRGMQQKVAIACALITDPPILLLDEPTLGLDVHAAFTVKQQVKALARTYGKTIVLTTHQLDMAEELCDRVVIIRKGKMIVDELKPKLLNLFQQEYFEFRFDMTANEVEPHLPELPLITATISGKEARTLLTGVLPDDVSIYQVLALLEQKGMRLHSFERAQPSLEEVFMQLTQNQLQ